MVGLFAITFTLIFAIFATVTQSTGVYHYGVRVKAMCDSDHMDVSFTDLYGDTQTIRRHRGDGAKMFDSYHEESYYTRLEEGEVRQISLLTTPSESSHCSTSIEIDGTIVAVNEGVVDKFHNDSFTLVGGMFY